MNWALILEPVSVGNGLGSRLDLCHWWESHCPCAGGVLLLWALGLVPLGGNSSHTVFTSLKAAGVIRVITYIKFQLLIVLAIPLPGE